MRFLDILDLGLTAANTAASMSAADKLDKLQKQSELAELQRSHMKQLRERIFGIKQLLEDMLRLEQSAPIVAAAGVRLIEIQLDAANIDPSQFTEFVDKEYVAQVIRQTKDQSYRLRAALSNQERNHVDAVIAAWRELPDLEYYLENRDALVSYNAVKDVVNGKKYLRFRGPSAYKQAKSNSSCVIPIGILISIVFALSMTFNSVTSDVAGSFNIVIFICVLLFTAFWFASNNFVKQYEPAKKQFDEALQKMNVQRMGSIEQRYKGNVEQMKLKRNEAKALLDNFVGGSSLPMLR